MVFTPMTRSLFAGTCGVVTGACVHWGSGAKVRLAPGTRYVRQSRRLGQLRRGQQPLSKQGQAQEGKAEPQKGEGGYLLALPGRHRTGM